MPFLRNCLFPAPFACLPLISFCSQRLKEISCSKSAELVRQYSQVRWLEQCNASMVARMNEANTLVSDLGARQRALEEELA